MVTFLISVSLQFDLIKCHNVICLEDISYSSLETDEMCNMYVMYWMNGERVAARHTCIGNAYQGWEHMGLKNIPTDVSTIEKAKPMMTVNNDENYLFAWMIKTNKIALSLATEILTKTWMIIWVIFGKIWLIQLQISFGSIGFFWFVFSSYFRFPNHHHGEGITKRAWVVVAVTAVALEIEVESRKASWESWGRKGFAPRNKTFVPPFEEPLFLLSLINRNLFIGTGGICTFRPIPPGPPAPKFLINHLTFIILLFVFLQ